MSAERRPTPQTFTPKDALTKSSPTLLGAPLGRVAVLAVLAIALPFLVAFLLANLRLRASAAPNDAAVTTDATVQPSPSSDPYDDGNDAVTTTLPSKTAMRATSTPIPGSGNGGGTDCNTCPPQTQWHPSQPANTEGGYQQPQATPAPYMVDVIASGRSSMVGYAQTSTPTPAPSIGGSTIAQTVTGESQVTKDVAKSTSAHELIPMLSSYVIAANTYLPAALTTAVNSDFPGEPTAMISGDVYDSIRQKYLLIPAGTEADGKYVSATVFGQNRIFILWWRLRFPPSQGYPDGSYLVLDDFPGTDQAGATALNARVDQHWGNLLGPALWLSALQTGTLLASGSNAYGASGAATYPTAGEVYASSLTEQLLNIGMQVSQRSLAQVPTLKISAGETFNIEVLNDMRFRAPYVAEGV